MDAQTAHDLATNALAQARNDVAADQQGNLQAVILHFDSVAPKMNALGTLQQAMNMLAYWSPKQGAALNDQIIVRDPLLARRVQALVGSDYIRAGVSLKPWWVLPVGVSSLGVSLLALLILATRRP